MRRLLLAGIALATVVAGVAMAQRIPRGHSPATPEGISGTFSNGITATTGDVTATAGGSVSGGSGTCTGADSALHDNNGGIGCQKLTDVAPQDYMIRPQPAFAGGTQTASDVNIFGGQDESLVAIDGADPSVSCAGDNDTVTVTVYDSNAASTATVLTEGTDWTATASVADTCASLATAFEALAGVGASCTSPNVLITLDANTGRVTLAESTAGCTTVTTGTDGYAKVYGNLRIAPPGVTTGYIGIENASGQAFNTGTPVLAGFNSGFNVVTSSGGTTTGSFKVSSVSSGSNTSSSSATVSSVDGFTYGSTIFILTAGTMTGNATGYVRPAWYKLAWTNAMVVALGAATTGNVLAATLPAKTIVRRAYVVIATAGAGTTTLTVSCGRVAAGYIDYVVASDAQAAANTVYGDAIAEVGTGLKDSGATALMDDLPSYTATTAINCQFVSTGANLDQVTTSTGNVFLQTELLP